MSHAGAPSLRHPRCPTCGELAVWPGNPARPFCSITCKLIDLGRWLDEGYRVPGPPVSAAPARMETAPAESDASP